MTRKEAREYIIEHCNPHRDTGTEWNDAMECAIKALAEPERKTGKWIPMFEGRYKAGAYWFMCSNCQHVVPGGLQSYKFYCENCGADMRGEQNE